MPKDLSTRSPRQVEVLGRAHTLRLLSEGGGPITLEPYERQYAIAAEQHIAGGKVLPPKQCSAINALYNRHYEAHMRDLLKEIEDVRKQKDTGAESDN